MNEETPPSMPKAHSDQDKLRILKEFLHRASGYGASIELNHMKVEGEYRYLHKKAGELLRELFSPVATPEPTNDIGDDF